MMSLEEMKKYERPGVEINAVPGGYAEISIRNQAACAKIATNGGHMMEYCPNGESPVLWMSRKSWLEAGKPLRGGIPICWPWFGMISEDKPGHGFARCSVWSLVGVDTPSADVTSVKLQLTNADVDPVYAPFAFVLTMEFIIGKTLESRLTMTNESSQSQPVTCALHTYFTVSDILNTRVHGFDGVIEVDTLKREIASAKGDLTFGMEFDRIYLNADGPAWIIDSGLKRRIRVDRTGSNSAVVWNPWIAKSKKMPDFGDDEYHTMVCVETANCRTDGRILAPGETHTLTQKISLEPWE